MFAQHYLYFDEQIMCSRTKKKDGHYDLTGQINESCKIYIDKFCSNEKC